jgi:hypothetical protein
MYDELAYTERIYGSVAEYNRVMREEMEYDPELGTYVPRKEEEPSEEELAASAKESRLYNRKLKALDGIPSEFAIRLKKEFEEMAPKKEEYADQNAYYYACRDFSSNRTLTVVREFEHEYGAVLSRDISPYNLPEGEFAISIEHHDHGSIYHYSVRNLSYEDFKTLFRDLEYLGESPTMFYGRKGERNTLILSNSSLGDLRYNDLSWQGLEDRKAMDAEAVAINRALYEANRDKARPYDGKCIKSFFKKCEAFHYIGQIDENSDEEYCYCQDGCTCSYEEKMGGAA